MFKSLLDKIKDLIGTITDIQEVYAYEPERFNGDPAATITPSDNESDYWSTAENIRVYAFSVRIFVTRTDKGKGQAENNLALLVHQIIDKLDRNYSLAGISVPTGYTMVNVFATPSAWGYSGQEDEYRVAEIKVRCRVAVNVTLIGS